jgi:hypothetical protein
MSHKKHVSKKDKTGLYPPIILDESMAFETRLPRSVLPKPCEYAKRAYRAADGEERCDDSPFLVLSHRHLKCVRVRLRVYGKIRGCSG